MSQGSTEEWERRKWYLIRSLFIEVPLLSPIPETLDPLESPSQLKDPVRRSYSSLPDLIIEKEPNRHDEPEEYYIDLEKKITKFYRKLFFNTDKSTDCLVLEKDDECFPTLYRDSYNNPTIINEKLLSPEPSFGDKESINNNQRSIEQCSFGTENNEDDISDLHDENSEKTRRETLKIHKKSISTDPINVNSSTTSSELRCNEIIITKAQVHHLTNEVIDNHTNYTTSDVMGLISPEIHDCSKKSIIPAAIAYTENSCEQYEYDYLEAEFEDSSISSNEYEVQVPMLKKRCYSRITDTSSPLQDPEIMRRRETSMVSVASVLNDGRYISEDFTTDKILEMTSVGEMEEIEDSIPELSAILGTTSTCKPVRHTQEYKREDKDRKRRNLSPSKSPAKQRKFENLAIQTSFSISDDESNWQKIQKKFFEGSPRIFKLCSCNNHVCC